MTINGATTPIVTQVRRSKRRRNSRRYGSMVWGLPIAGTKSRPARTGCLKAWALERAHDQHSQCDMELAVLESHPRPCTERDDRHEPGRRFGRNGPPGDPPLEVQNAARELHQSESRQHAQPDPDNSRQEERQHAQCRDKRLARGGREEGTSPGPVLLEVGVPTG